MRPLATASPWPVRPDSAAISMFRVVLEEYQQLCQRRKTLEADIVARLAGHPDFDRLQTVPGIGPILALLILAEAGDLRRFGHVRQFLKYCGFDLCTEQSGQFRGTTHLSKRARESGAGTGHSRPSLVSLEDARVRSTERSVCSSHGRSDRGVTTARPRSCVTRFHLALDELRLLSSIHRAGTDREQACSAVRRPMIRLRPCTSMTISRVE